MHVGVVGYSNHSGLGQIIRALREQGIVDSQLVIPHDVKGTHALEEFPHSEADLKPTKEQLNEYLNKYKPDAIIFIETPFNFDYFQELKSKDIKTILIPMIDSIEMEQFVPHQKYIDLVIHPTKIGYQLYKQKGWKGKFIHLPWPVNTDEFNPDKILDKSCTFLHNEGFGGAGFRKGTDIVYTAFQQLSYQLKTIQLFVRSQCAELEHSQIKKNTKNVIVNSEDVKNAVAVYEGGKVYLAPSRREGLGLPIPEAMACGLPVITTNAPPMNEWTTDQHLLVEVQSKFKLRYGDPLMYIPRVIDLMNKMKFAAENLDLMEEIGEQNCKIIQEKFSWSVLKNVWQEVIRNC